MDKQEVLVRTAFKLFYQHGIHAVGVNLILAESGIAKRTLYNYFPSKDDLIEATVRYRDHEYYTWLNESIESVPVGKSALLELFNALDDWFNSRVDNIENFNGCFFVNASAEFGNREHAVHKACAEHKYKVTALIKSHVSDFCFLEKTIERITNLVVMLKEGAISIAHVQGNLNAALEAKCILNNVLEKYC